jgi:hypothetical protein
MTRIYQPIVIEIMDELVETLKEMKFFEDHEITDLTFTKKFLSEKLTEKYIENGLDVEMGLFTEDEFDNILRHIISGTMLYSLKERGFINSYEDDDIEEMFFLTDEGKKLLGEIKKDSEES